MAAAAPRLDDPSDPARGAGPSRAYAGYVLGVLVLMNLLNHVDRNIVAVLLEGAMTALSGLAKSFPQLLALRMGVGIAKA